MAVQQGGSRTPFQKLVAGVSQAAQATFAFVVRTTKKISTDGVVILASFAVIAAYVAFIWYLWQQEFFEVPEGDAGPEVVAAVVALLGGLFAALLTFAGVLLKHSLDTRAEERLKLDTFVRAAGLLATNAGKETPATQQAAALFVLADLNHLRFALALLDEMWRERKISPSAACWLIDRCLQTEDEHLQVEAAGMLGQNADNLSSVACFAWPEVLERKWPRGLHRQARIYILEALLKCLMARRADKWSPGCLITFVVLLVRIKKEDKNRNLRNGAILFLDKLLSHEKLDKRLREFSLGSETVNASELRLEVSDLARHPSFRTYGKFRETAATLEEWMAEAPPHERPPKVEETSNCRSSVQVIWDGLRHLCRKG